MKRYFIVTDADMPISRRHAQTVSWNEERPIEGSEPPDFESVIVTAEQWPSFGEWHSIDLGSHGPAGAGHHAVVLCDEHITAPLGWHELPHLLDPQPRDLHPAVTATGAPATAAGYALAKHLGSIHAKFRP